MDLGNSDGTVQYGSVRLRRKSSFAMETRRGSSVTEREETRF